ncbi:MAG: methyltransferase domain-containing protein [Acidimicrobiales bacterium]
MIERARADHGGIAEFATGDVYALDFPDDRFDIVHAHQVLQHLVDPVSALREMRRVTRPGGIVAVRDADYGGMTWAPLTEVSTGGWRRTRP